MKLHIVHIYPNEMNTYGDRGNLLTLQKRAEWHGFEPIISYYSAGQTFPKEADIILGGGGQDSAQSDIQADILRIGSVLHKEVDAGTPMIMVCGTYQLFGKRFITHDGEEIQGIGIFDIETHGSPKRLIGNVAVETEGFGTLYGFENHSGRTVLSTSQQPLGTVSRGNGNNGEDKTEGARTNNAIGTYLHGPLLPNNPALADGLIAIAMQKKGRAFIPKTLNDSWSQIARKAARSRTY